MSCRRKVIQLMSFLLSFQIGIAELLVIAVVGLVVFSLALLSAYMLYLMGHPTQALICGVISLTGVGVLVGFVWVIVVAIIDRSRRQDHDRLPEVPE